MWEGVESSNGEEARVVEEMVHAVGPRRADNLVKRTKMVHVHDEENQMNVGDRVRVQETRPLSKLKRWRLLEILERAK